MFKRPFVDEHGFDTAHYLFADVYYCNIPAKQLLSLDELRMYGMPSVMDPHLDRQMANEIRQVMLNIDKIFEHWRAGSDIRIARPEDTKKIYDRVQNHLNDWRYYMQSRLNQGNAPLEDLVDLDRFASVLYNHAKFHGESGTLESFMTRNTSARFQSTVSIVESIRNGEFLKQRQQEQHLTEESIHDRYPQRESMAEHFTTRRRIGSLNQADVARASQAGGDSAESFASMLFGNGGD